MKIKDYEITITVKPAEQMQTSIKFSLLIPADVTSASSIATAIEKAAKEAVAKYVEEKTNPQK